MAVFPFSMILPCRETQRSFQMKVWELEDIRVTLRVWRLWLCFPAHHKAFPWLAYSTAAPFLGSSCPFRGPLDWK